MSIKRAQGSIGILCCLLSGIGATRTAHSHEPSSAPALAGVSDEASGAQATGENREGTPGAVAGERTIPLRPAAQAAPPAVQSAAAQLDDIVVTATKRRQSTREIAGTVNALDGADLERMGARELKDFIGLVPGITLQEGTNNAWRKFTTRGIGAGDRANQTTGQLIGDVPLTDPYAAYVLPDLDPFDLRTVEVLKGPQGTVFGASALNGAIRYVPNVPELAQWSGRAFVEYVAVEQGGHGPTFGAVLNAPVGEALALRLSGVVQQVPGVYDNNARRTADADRGDKWSGRAMARWQATERLGVNVLYLRQQSQLHDRSVADNRDARLESDNRPGPSAFKLGFDLANLDLRYAFDWGTLISQTSRLTKLQDFDMDASDILQQTGEQGVQSLRVAAHPHIESYVQELRLVSPDGGAWSWIGGIFFQDYKADIDLDAYGANTGAIGPVLEPLPGIGLDSPNGISASRAQVHPLAAQERALFGEVTRKLGSRWELTAGARYYRTRLDAEVEQSGALVVPSDPRSSGTGHFHQAEHGISPKLALALQVTEDVLGYAAASRGYQFGGINPAAPTVPTNTIPPSYSSSTLWSYEAGVRTDWFMRTLRLDLTAYLLDWKDAQISQAAPQPDGTLYVDNVGTVRSQGVEASFAWLTPLEGISLRSAASYLVARTTEPYQNDDSTVPAGTAMPAAPRLQTATTLAWQGFFEAWAGGADLVHTYTGKAFSNIAHNYEIYDYHALGVNLHAGLPHTRYAPMLTLGISNLLDERGLIGRTAGSTSLTGEEHVYSYYTRPRTLSLRLEAGF
ncbi:MAG TPA: TonB-dependent receptor [Solimonas sp.]|nr:TonB-dependent receptor [Solimonas sp.]